MHLSASICDTGRLFHIYLTYNLQKIDISKKKKLGGFFERNHPPLQGSLSFRMNDIKKVNRDIYISFVPRKVNFHVSNVFSTQNLDKT